MDNTVTINYFTINATNITVQLEQNPIPPCISMVKAIQNYAEKNDGSKKSNDKTVCKPDANL